MPGSTGLRRADTWRAAAVAFVLTVQVPADAGAQVVRDWLGANDLRPGEVTTAVRPGGQAGGQRLALGARAVTLRCAGANEAIVGVRIRRGHVLDYVQIACAVVACDANGCRWTNRYWGRSSGSEAGGDSHPPMTCRDNEMLSGLRARVRIFAGFDFAADIAIDCSRIVGRDGGFFRVSADPPTQHHPEGGFGRTTTPPGVTEGPVTPDINCRPNGGATALATAEGDWPFRRGHRVAQVLALLCPGTRPAPDPNCPPQLALAGVADQAGAMEAQWFTRGGRTGGAALATMEARPADRDWRGRRIHEQVRTITNTCNLRDSLCGVGRGRDFVIGQQGGNVDIPNFRLGFPLRLAPGVRANNIFVDTHLVLDSAGADQPAGVSILGQLGLPGPCVVQCRQVYTCGAGAQQVTYPPFTITYTLRRGTFQPRLQFPPIPIPGQPAQDVTRVEVRKQ